MDRHLFGFLELAGLGQVAYWEGQDLVHKTADLMQLDRAHLDHSIWRYMSGGKASAIDGMPGCLRQKTQSVLGSENEPSIET